MLVLPSLHTYLSQLLAPPTIHSALLLTPEGALVSYASQMNAECGGPSSPESDVSSSPNSKPGSVVSIETRVLSRSKDEIRMTAGLGAEVWAETRGEGEGLVESELGRILVLAVEDGDGKDTAPLLLLAVNGTMEADWDAMRVKAQTLARFLAPSVNRHRGTMTGSVNVKSQPGRGLNR